MKRQNRQFTKFISLLKFPGLQYFVLHTLDKTRVCVSYAPINCMPHGRWWGVKCILNPHPGTDEMVKQPHPIMACGDGVGQCAPPRNPPRGQIPHPRVKRSGQIHHVLPGGGGGGGMVPRGLQLIGALQLTEIIPSTYSSSPKPTDNAILWQGRAWPGATSKHSSLCTSCTFSIESTTHSSGE